MILKIFVDLKLSVRFTRKELRCELSSSFDIISNSEKQGMLFFANCGRLYLKTKRRMKVKENTGYRNFSQTRRKKTIQQF